MDSKKILTVFERFRAVDPSPTTELIYHSSFELLIAVILSAQTTDKAVNKATRVLFSVANTPESLLRLGELELKAYIRTINLYPTKARNIIKTCQLLIDRHDAQVPQNRDHLEALPGVGPKTASVVLNTAFREPTIPVDTHVFRVCHRVGLALSKTPRAMEQALSRVIPNKYKLFAHHWLILHGRYVCKSRHPACNQCLIRDLCHYGKSIMKQTNPS